MSPAASTRWCPTPEQVMILEEMYRGGVRTPNASHIQQITAHLSLYGKIEGKNVFYWFQNHKARDRQKLRKRLLGKQQQQQQQQHHQHQLLHHHHHHFDHHPILFPIPSVDHHPCQQPPPPPPFPHRHHQHQLPCCPSSSVNVGFHHPPHMFNPPYFSPPHIHHQSRSDESCLAMTTTNIYNWKGDSLRTQSFGVENQKLVRFSNNNDNDNDNDWMMMNDYDNHDTNSYDDHFTTTTTSLKTLQLFPIKDNTSLKLKDNNNTQG